MDVITSCTEMIFDVLSVLGIAKEQQTAVHNELLGIALSESIVTLSKDLPTTLENLLTASLKENDFAKVYTLLVKQVGEKKVIELLVPYVHNNIAKYIHTVGPALSEEQKSAIEQLIEESQLTQVFTMPSFITDLLISE